MGVDFHDIKREQRALAGKTIPVAVTPRLKPRPKIAPSLKSLASGMGLTFKYFSHGSTRVTRQYPENRATLKFPERYRAILRLIYEDNGYHRCTACKLCEKACPNLSIRVLTRKGEVSGKLELDRYIWRLDSCVFCNACVQSCPFNALEMGHEFENAVYDRRLLIFTLNRYAGPPASVLLKQEDPEIRRKMMEPRDRYGGPVPMNGQAMPVVAPLSAKGEQGGQAGGGE